MKAKPLPPYVKGTTEGKLYVDTSHPAWIQYFTDFIKKNVGRIKTNRP